jgi:BASS family bile acid:Na+ symporter
MSWIPSATLFVMMAALGMTLRRDDFARLGREPRAVLFGLIGQLLLLPLVAFGLATALPLSETLAVGLVLIASCPGGVTSNLLSYAARGNVALSISLTAASSLVSFLTVPFLLGLAFEAFGGAGAVALSVREMVATLFGATVVPVLLGMGLLRWRPALAGRLRGPLVGVSGTVLLLLIVGLGASLWSSGTDIEGLVARGAPAVALLISIAMTIGWLGGRALGLDAATNRTLSIEIGMQNFALAMAVSMTFLEEPLYLGAALLYLPLMLLFSGFIVALGRRAQAPVTP